MKKFELGTVVVTKAISDKMALDKGFDAFVKLSLGRFIKGDWGNLCAEDKEQNEEALKNNDQRLMGSYENKSMNWKIWIITEWDRSTTTVLFPEDY